MFQRLEIQNFQSHKHTTLDFVPGVNVIVGQSDSGKTAILRALRWVIRNKPAGDAFRSDWGGDTIVRLETEEGIVQRIKSAKDNMYIVGEQELRAIGHGVPEEVSLLLNMSDVNIQAQFDRPFLLDDSPGEVARYLNQIAQLDVIDRGRKNVEKWYREIESDIRYKRAEKEKLEENLREYDYLPKLEADIEAVEQQEVRLKQVSQKVGKLKQLIQAVEELQKKQEEYSEILSMEGPVDKILNQYSQKRDLESKVKTLRGLIARLTRVQASIAKNEKLIKAKGQVDRLLNLYDERDKIQEKNQNLQQLIRRIEQNQQSGKIIGKKILEMESKFGKYMPDICPLCGQEVKHVD